MALRLLGEMTHGENKSAKVYRDTEFDEHRVKFYENGQYLTEADYHCPDFQDAVDTANHWLKN